MPTYRTANDLARVMCQSHETACRVLREVFGPRDELTDWAIGEGEWMRVLRHLEFNDERQYGCRRHHPPKAEKPVQICLL